VTLFAVGWTKIVNPKALFDGGACDYCGAASGARTSTPMEIGRLESNVDCGKAMANMGRGDLPWFPDIHWYSGDLLDHLTPAERKRLSLRLIVRDKRSTKKLYEIVGSRVNFPTVEQRGSDDRETLQCDKCGAMAERTGHNVALSALPDSLPSCFTVSRGKEFWLCLAKDRWREFAGEKGTRGVVGSDLSILPDDLVETRPAKERPLSVAKKEREEERARESQAWAEEQKQRERAAEQRKSNFPKLLVKAKGGDAKAQYQVAEEYGNGVVTERDLAASFRWMTRAARQGHEDAMLGLPILYLRGGTVKKSIETWERLMLKAAKKFPRRAYEDMFTHYDNGVGVARNKELAKKYSRLALAHGSKWAK
jgi:hypothetical protein